MEYDVANPVFIPSANRKATCNAFVLPADNKPFLLAISIEELDVLIQKFWQELIVNPKYPNYVVLKMK